MTALKIFAALFVVAVTQASAASLSRDKPIQDESSLIVATFGLHMGNPLACIGNLPEAYRVVQEMRGLWVDYKRVRETDDLLKAQCAKLEDQVMRDNCIKDADDVTAAKISFILERVSKELVPHLVKVLWAFKECLFD